MTLIVALVVCLVGLILIDRRRQRREIWAHYDLVDSATSHPEMCDCNGCHDAGLGAWAPGGFMNPHVP
jgi:hypothetical protein